MPHSQTGKLIPKLRCLLLVVVLFSLGNPAFSQPGNLGTSGKDGTALVEVGARLEARTPDLSAVSEGDEWVKAAQISIREGDLDVALEEYNEAFYRFRSARDSLGMAAVLNDQGTIHFELGDLNRAEQYFRRALATQEAMRDSTGISVSINNLAAVLTVLGKYEEAIGYHLRSKKLKERRNDTRGVANSLNNLANIYTYQGKLGEAYRNYESSLERYSELDDSLGMAVSLNNLGSIETMRGNIDSARTLFYQALALHQALGNAKGIADAYSNLGNAANARANYSEALSHYQEALQTHTIIGDRQGVAQSLNNIGMISVVEGKDSLGLYYFRKSLAISEELGNLRGMAVAYVNMGEVFANQGDTIEALDFQLLALQIRQQLGDPQGIAASSNQLGELYANMGKYQDAVELFRQALKIQEEMGNPRGIAVSYNHIARQHLKLENYPQAIEASRTGLRYARDLGARDQMQISYENLSYAHEQLGNTGEALQYYKLATAIRDSIQQDFNNEKISELQAQYDLGQKNREIDLLRKDKEISESEILRQRQSIWFILGGFVLVAIFFVVLYTRIRAQQNLKAEQERLEYEKQLIQFEQKALRLQMNPHFIFNSLNAIGSFIYENDKGAAARYLSRFAKLMRLILEYSQETRIPVAREIEILQHYLELEKTRHEQKFDFTIEAHPASIKENVLIPPMLVQPHVENAIIHGLTPRGDGGHLHISFEEKGDRIVCTVEDDGIGRKAAAERKKNSRMKHRSMATQISQRRVDIMNRMLDAQINFDIIDLYNDDGTAAGTRVVISMPATGIMDLPEENNPKHQIA